jgi:hypothetical protein
MPSRIRPMLTALAAAGALIITGQAQALGGPGVVRVSGPSPYADCPAHRGEGILYPEAEVEPMVAANAADPWNLIGVWQQDRWNSGGSHGLAAGYTFDGGRHWAETTLPFSRCAPGGLPYQRASDPWVSIGVDGTAYAVGLSFSATKNAIASATSRDGGRTWGTLRRVVDDPDVGIHFDDKESVTADPTTPGVAYVVWDRTRQGPDGHQRSPAVFSKTTDGGDTWSRPRPIAGNGPDDATVGNVLVVDPRTHRLYDFYGRYPPENEPRIEFVTSADGGTTWSQPHALDVIHSAGVIDPNTGETVRTLDFGPTVAIDPDSGVLYVAWQTYRFRDFGTGRPFDEVGITRSTDGGHTWSALRRASTDTGRAAFIPTLAVGADGTVGLSYYDFRRLTATQQAHLPTDYWLRTSRDGGRDFGPDQHIAGPFDMKAAPDAGGLFVGDYEGLTSAGKTFVAFFAQSNCETACPENRTDIYASRLVPLPHP